MTSASPHQDKQIEALKALVMRQAEALDALMMRVMELERAQARSVLASLKRGRVQKIAP